MNPTQAGNLFKSLLIMCGVSGAWLSAWIPDDVFVSIGGALISLAVAVGAAVSMYISNQTKRLIESVANAPEDKVAVPPSVAAAVKAKVVPLR